MIESSELIITESGCIYHLDLHTEELASTVITVGDPGRVPLISKYFDRIEVRKSHREFVSHTGYIGSKRITVLSTGIGPDNIDIVMNELDALVNIDFDSRTLKKEIQSLNIIRLGTSGALIEGVPVDSLVASAFGIGLDNLLLFYKYENNAEELHILDLFKKHSHLMDNPVSPYIAEGSIHLRKQFNNGFYKGITVTCPGFYGPQGRRLRLENTYPHLIDTFASFDSGHYQITNFEMETSAIYALGKLLGHHCLSINTIINNRIEKTFSKDMNASVENMIQRSLEIIEQLDS